MKSVSVAAAAAVLAGISIAQPHGHHGHQHHHAKRELVTEWETVWETVTVLVDETATQTILPTHPTDSGAPGEFFQPSPSSTSTSTPEPTPQPTVVETPSVEAPAPTPTTTVEASSPPPPPPPPAPTTTYTPEPAPAPAPVPTSVEAPAPPVESPSTPASGSSSGSTGQLHSGDITHYTVGLGACGYDDSGKDDSSPIVAISAVDWNNVSHLTNTGIDSPAHPWCDKTITIHATNGKSTTAVVRDQCPGCASGSIDVSDVVFKILFGDLGLGRTQITWSFS
jgi:hypothetical protein